MKIHTTHRHVFLGILVGASIFALFGFQGGSPWVRLQSLFAPNAQEGHVSVDGKVGANGVELQDNVRGDGYLKFPGEAPILNRADLIGPTGDQGDQGNQGIQGVQGVQGIQGIPGVSGPGRLLLVTVDQGGADWVNNTDVATINLNITESAVVVVTAEVSIEGRGLVDAVGDIAIHATGTGFSFDLVNYPVYHYAVVPNGTRSQRNVTTSRLIGLTPGSYTLNMHITGSTDNFAFLTLPRLTAMVYATP